MSTDIIACKKLKKEYNDQINTDKEIASFTLSLRLNDYQGAMDLFTDNYENIFTEDKDRAVFDIYVFSRQKIIELKKINDEKNFGDDVTWFLNQLLSSDVDIFYIKIF